MTDQATIPQTLAPIVEKARAEIERLAPCYLGGSTGCRTAVASVRSRAHSTVMVIALEGDAVTRRFYLKTLKAAPASRDLKRRQIAEEFRLLDDLSLRFGPHEGLGVITPVRCWPEDLSMLTEEFPGEKLSAVIGQARRYRSTAAADHVARLCQRVGRWLALFQGFTKPVDERPFDPAPLLAYCDGRLRLLTAAPRGGVTTALARAVSARLERLARGIDPADLAPVGRQNDFRPDNIMTAGEAIAVLDFTGYTVGPTLYDFMKFWMKLQDLAFGPLFRRADVRRWQDAFREGYGTPVDLASPLARLLRLANVLDKMSEFAGSGPGPFSLRTPILVARQAAHARWLRLVASGAVGGS